MTVRKAAIAGAWSTIDIVLRQGVGFAVSIVLARLLLPSDFGVVALLAIFSSLPVVFIQMGLSTALVQRRETTIEEESTLFWCNVLASVVLAVAAIAVAPFLADYYENPVLRPLMFAVAAQVVLASLGTVHSALLTRELRFDQLSKAGLAASLISGALGIGAALFGAGVWALALQLTAAVGVNAALLWVVSDWRPRLRFRLVAPWTLMKFGAHVGFAGMLDVLYTQGFALIVGKLHGVRELGLYNRAYTTQLFPSGVLSNIIGRLIVPLFASRADDPAALVRGVRLANGLSMLVNVPMMIGLAMTADLVVVTLFGDKWLGAVPVLFVLALGGVLLPLHVVNVQLLLAQGRSDRYVRVEMIKKTMGLACVVVGSFFGILGLAYSQLVFTVAALIFNCHFTRMSIGYGFVAQLRDIAGLGVAAAAMALTVAGLREWLVLTPPFELATLVAAGAVAYVGTGFALRIDGFIKGFDVVRVTLFSRPRPDGAQEA